MAESDWDESVVLDREHLKGYTGGDAYLARDVLKIFLDNAPLYLDALSSAEGDGWRSSAHKLKGAARGIGAWRLARAAERAEMLGEPAANDPRRGPILDTLKERLAELEGVINAG
ncbi:Hpt domain-containing protein [Kordiimonas lacus]|uniref:HPt (Histidine-containing phosphotransfer) domain-containing protein n=1 Tax=Kordiimonas lacus TaxID=637679 RepID=A0A1G6VYH0_9PROT|nr:Hpt domain-containing protein [Kordiimonas lacus]SDD57825.1 HPt (histidine-containing phosphotransfer) domain-containing protein [Kordiimonas lacus]